MQNLQTKVKHPAFRAPITIWALAGKKSVSLSSFLLWDIFEMDFLSAWCRWPSLLRSSLLFADRWETESTVSSQEAAEGCQGRSQGFPWWQEQKVRSPECRSTAPKTSAPGEGLRPQSSWYLSCLFFKASSLSVCSSLCLCIFLRAVEVKRKAVQRIEEQLMKLQVQATDREENKQIALGTSKLNYLDPRISVAWYLHDTSKDVDLFFTSLKNSLDYRCPYWKQPKWLNHLLFNRPTFPGWVGAQGGLPTLVIERQEMLLHCRKRSSTSKKANGMQKENKRKKSVWARGTMGFVSES